jgi:hypothetical protein
MMTPFPDPVPDAALAARIWRPGIGACLAALRDTEVVDITSRDLPTMQALLAGDDPAATLRGARGETVCTLNELALSRARRSSGDQGLGRDLCRLDGRAGDRGAGGGRPRARRSDPRADRRHHRREPVGAGARL